jgi:hypothetical protein
MKIAILIPCENFRTLIFCFVFIVITLMGYIKRYTREINLEYKMV